MTHRAHHAHHILVTAIATIAACSPMAFYGGSTAGSGPSHAKATEAEWNAAEQRARDQAHEGGAASLEEPIRIAEQGFQAHRHIEMTAGHCYHVGIGWSFDAALNAGLSYDAGTNQNLAGTTQRFDGNQARLDFCADRTGGATLTLSAVPRTGALRTHELLEYAVVVGSSVETRAQRLARHEHEREQARQAREQEAAQQRLGAQEAADDAKRKCHECRERYASCTSGDCRRDFFLCSNDNDYSKLSDVDARPCGEP